MCGIWVHAKDGWAARGRHLSWEEYVEIRGDMYRSLSQITLCFFRDPGAAEQVGPQVLLAPHARLKRELI
jgi:hypothetical protein